MVFPALCRVSGAKDKIGIGTYELNTDMDYRALISAMHNASGSMNTDTVRVTIPEGYTVEQIIALLAKKRGQHRRGSHRGGPDGYL